MHLLAISPGAGWDAARWKAVLTAGVDAFLIREKQLEARPLLDLVRRVQDLAPDLELWVAGRLDVALAAGCGLHAPESYPDADLALVPVSRPLHSEGQWEARSGCAQLLIAPVLPAPGKGEPWGISRLHGFLDELPKQGPRLLALGGVNPGSVHSLRHPHLAGVALIRALWSGPDPAAVVEHLRASWQG
jgi:thiamine monophosphate synthase